MLVLEWIPATGAADGLTVERLEFDAVVRAIYEGTSEATSHPVETGAAVTDHVRPAGETLSLEAIVTNTPIVAVAGGMDGTVGEVRPATLRIGGRTVTANTLQWSTPFDRVRGVDAILRALRDTAQLLTVRTAVRELADVVVTRYRVERDAESGNALALTLELSRVRLVATQRVTDPTPRERRGRRRQQRGPQPATVPVNESLWHRVLNRLVNQRTS